MLSELVGSKVASHTGARSLVSLERPLSKHISATTKFPGSSGWRKVMAEAEYDPLSSTFTWVTLPKHSKFSLSPASFLQGRSQVVLCLIALGIRGGGTCRTPRSRENVLCSSPAHEGMKLKQKQTFHTLHPAWGCIQPLALHLRAAEISRDVRGFRQGEG